MLRQVFFLFGALLISTSGVMACSCGPILSPEHHIESSEYVFLGIAGATIQNTNQKNPYEPSKVTEFEIIDLLKGAAASKINIYHDQPDGGNCGVSFISGEKHRIFAGKYLGYLYTSECDLSRPDVSEIGWPWSYYRKAVGKAD